MYARSEVYSRHPFSPPQESAHDRGARGLHREMLAEFLGTFVLILFGAGVVAQVVLSSGTAGSYLSINVAWGLAWSWAVTWPAA
jgi:hypothetical protein